MASRKLADLHPGLVDKATTFIAMCADAGIEVMLTCTYRSSDEQEELYAQGRTKPGKIVTKVRGGHSKHNFTVAGHPASKAFDFVPIVNGKAVWNDLNLFKRCGEIGEALGLTWGGSWTSFKDYPHMEIV